MPNNCNLQYIFTYILQWNKFDNWDSGDNFSNATKKSGICIKPSVLYNKKTSKHKENVNTHDWKLITDKEPCKFAVNKRQNTNYSFLPITCIRRKRGIINKMTSISWSISKHEQLHLFFPDARTFHNIYKLQKHVLLRHQSYLTLITDKEPCKFAVNKRQNANYSFLPVTSKVSCIRRKRGQIICLQGNNNIYKLQKHVLLRHQSYLIVFMGNKNLRYCQIMPF
jgi:protease II